MAADRDSARTRVSLRTAEITDAGAYARTMASLEQQAFWSGRGKVRKLWPHQRTAIALAAAYVCSDKTLDVGGTEAALIKMPTGTGKSGVVASIARCLPTVRRVLVLTPRTALADQLRSDVAERFWGNMGYEVQPPQTWSDVSIEPAQVELLLPNVQQLKHLMQLPVSERMVLVGTLQALDQVRTKRDELDRKSRRGRPLTAEELETQDITGRMMSWLKGFDLIVVDEGHYEPAPSWSWSVRELKRPTVLLSATPFRNDYKLFQVKGRFVFNYPFQAARDENIVRAVEMVEIVAGKRRRQREKASDNDNITPTRLTREDRSAVDDFVAGLKSQLPPLLKASNVIRPKVIVRAGSFEILELLQTKLEKAFGEAPVLIHDRVEGNVAEQQRRRYNNVARARAKDSDATYWLHQSKLLEGIDEPTYVAVAIFDPFTNARQLVQQVGRVLRSTDPTRMARQTAHVLLPSGLFTAAQLEWARYLEFEAYAATGLGGIVPSEAYLPEKIVGAMPEMQYVDGRFRHRLPNSVSVGANDIVVPRRAAVFETEDAFDLGIANTEILESILASNRFVVRPIDGLPPDVLGWTFFTVDESPYLSNHFITEWRFGVALAARVRNHLFVFDSDGLTFSPSRVGAARPAEGSMTRLLPASSTITQVSANSLDMSDRAIRSLTQRTRSFAETFTDLLDPMLRPTTVTGYVEDQVVTSASSARRWPTLPMRTFPSPISWPGHGRSKSSSPIKMLTPNSVFLRYATRVKPDRDKAEKPVNILLDLTEEALREFGLRGGGDHANPPDGVLAYEDLCADIENSKFSIKGLDGVDVACSIRFNPETLRYAINSKALNERHPPLVTSRANRAIALTERINTSQAFRVLTSQDGVVYMYGEFLKARDVLSATGTVLPLECAVAIPELRDTKSEKGENFFSKPAAWAKSSVFGLVKSYCANPGTGGGNDLERALRGFDLVLLDDDSSELGDFIAIGERRLAIVHAKASSKLSVGGVTKLEAVGRQSAASLAFCSTMAQVDGIENDRWKRPTQFNAKTVVLPRIFRNEKNVPENDVAATVRAALTNPSYDREVWIVAGRLLDVEKTRDRARKKALTNRDRQLLMFLESLGTACGRANARLRIFGH